MTVDDQVLAAPRVSGPSGLSDLAVSPYGMPPTLLRGEVRVAFLGRTSTEDQQDPRQSMIRQLNLSKTALPDAWVIVCHFYDVESGRKGLDERGSGSGYEERFAIPIARDGGIADLLAEAERPDRRFDVVICESVSRVARRTFEGLSIERALEDADVPLLASNEPISMTGGRAQRVLQRRINQSVAEYEVMNILEQSWGGLCAHVRDGYNLGQPPYGYKAKVVPHPNPAKAAKGHTKTRLEPDGERAQTVTQIADWRYYDKLGYGTIAERLNADLDQYPPPEPPSKRRRRGAWSKSSVNDLLRNPKYTGFQVFNRRAMRSRHGAVNDPAKWVWSPEPTHEPLIPKWMYDKLAAQRLAHRGSRDSSGTNTHPATRHGYVLRGRLFCACGRRMFGKHRQHYTYYSCWPRGNNRGRPDAYPDHPKAAYIREDTILDAAGRFYADRVFGPDRRDLLAADLATLDDRAAAQRDTERHRLNRALADIDRRQATILRQAQQGEVDDPFTQGLRRTYNDLDSQKTDTTAALADLDTTESTEPRRPSHADMELLDALPYVAVHLTHAPDQHLRHLFDTTQLTAQLNQAGDEVSFTITLPAHDLPTISTTAERMFEAMMSRQQDQPITALAQMQTVPPTGFEPVLPP